MSATTVAGVRAGSKGWTIGLWVLQVALAALFAMAGQAKAFTPQPELGTMMAWTNDVPFWFVRFIGASELAAAVGLILPAATRIKPALTAWAGVGLTFVMLSAAGFHVMRGEMQFVPMTLVLGTVAAFIAWGRFTKAPIAPRA